MGKSKVIVVTKETKVKPRGEKKYHKVVVRKKSDASRAEGPIYPRDVAEHFKVSGLISEYNAQPVNNGFNFTAQLRKDLATVLELPEGEKHHGKDEGYIKMLETFSTVYKTFCGMERKEALGLVDKIAEAVVTSRTRLKPEQFDTPNDLRIYEFFLRTLRKCY